MTITYMENSVVILMPIDRHQTNRDQGTIGFF